MKKKQPIFVDFYNLHLKSGYAQRVDVVPSPPDEKERQRLMRFFSDHEYMHQITGNASTQKGSLSWYEREKGISWFDSDDFLGLTKEYREVTVLIDSYLSGEVPIQSLKWLDKSIKEYKGELSLIQSPQGMGMPVPIEWLESEGKTSVDIGEFGFTTSRRFFRGELPYGIDLEHVMYGIHTSLVNMLEKKLSVGYCSHEVGKRNPYCENIFIPSRTDQKFCTQKCKSNYHNRIRDKKKHAEYMRNKRDPDHPSFCREYRWWAKD